MWVEEAESPFVRRKTGVAHSLLACLASSRQSAHGLARSSTGEKNELDQALIPGPPRLSHRLQAVVVKGSLVESL